VYPAVVCGSSHLLSAPLVQQVPSGAARYLQGEPRKYVNLELN
jgi:hypothetical protein